jgi:large repetitive protein
MKFLGNIRLAGKFLLPKVLLSFMALVLSLGWIASGPVQAGTWIFTGSMATARGGDIILLPNGLVLAAGGWGGLDGQTPLSSAELYNPATGLWSDTGSMAEGRAEFTLTLLNNGKVLAIGGSGMSGDLKSCELYNPDTGLWGGTGALAAAREMSGVTLLPDGKVLASGGSYRTAEGYYADLSSAELYDPDSGLWGSAGSLKTARHGPVAMLLLTGKVLVAGGWGGAPNGGFLTSCELYDPDKGLFSDTGSFKDGRAGMGAVLLPGGKVLLAGGWGGTWDNNYPLSSCQLYDPGTGLWSDTGSLIIARQEQPAVLLPSGEVLTFGGYGPSETVRRSSELYNPATGRWRLTGSLDMARVTSAAALLPNGKVLTAGGHGIDGRLNRAELYTPGESARSAELLLLE